MIRPVTEIERGVVVAVNEFTGHCAHEVFGEPAGFDESATAEVVRLGGRVPAVSDDQGGSIPGRLVGELGSDLTERSIGDRTSERSAAHATFHRSQIEIFDNDPAVGGRQPGCQLVRRVLAEVNASPVERGELGFRSRVTSGTGDAS